VVFCGPGFGDGDDVAAFSESDEASEVHRCGGRPGIGTPRDLTSIGRSMMWRSNNGLVSPNPYRPILHMPNSRRAYMSFLCGKYTRRACGIGHRP
jgi:hypothetical protein